MTPDRLHTLLTAAASNVELFDGRTMEFLEDLTHRFETEGEIDRLSPAQERWLGGISAELARNHIRWEEDL